MAKIYHYTDISTLALILHNQTIRFNRLDCVDDPEEFDFEHNGLRPAGYYFVSCWTRNHSESLPQWSMYGHKNHGVRIGLDEIMFNFYEYKGRKCFRPGEEIVKMSDFVILPILTDNESGVSDIIYVDDPSKYRQQIIGNTEDGAFVNFKKLGLYKSYDWAFQKECRIAMTIIPKIMSEDNRCKPIQYALENKISTEITFYDLQLKNDIYQNMEIMLGPSTSMAEELIVKSLMRKYLDREDCLRSKYTGKTK